MQCLGQRSDDRWRASRRLPAHIRGLRTIRVAGSPQHYSHYYEGVLTLLRRTIKVRALLHQHWVGRTLGIKYGEILRCWPAARSRPASTTSAIFPIPAPAPSCCKRSAVLQLPGLLLNGAALQQLRGVGRPLSSVRLSPAPVPCGRGQPSHGALCRCGRGRPSPGADVAGMVHTDAHAGAFSCLVAHLTWAPSAFPISPVPLTPMHTYAQSHLRPCTRTPIPT